MAIGRVKLLSARRATRLLGVQRGMQLVACPRFLATTSRSSEDKQKHEETPRTWGDKFVVVGLVLRGAAMLPRFAGSAQLLRFAGVGPMMLGTVVTAYELGGWKLVLGVPAACLAYAGTSIVADTVLESRLKEEVIRDLQQSCPDVPEEAFEALRQVRACQYETNHVKLQVEWPASGPQWRIEVLAERQTSFSPQPWSVTKLKMLSARAGMHNGELPPQTRNWDFRVQPVQWDLLWNRA